VSCWPVTKASDCETQVDHQIASPDRAYVATVFHRECGATSGFNTQLSLRRQGEPFDPTSDQILAVDGRHNLSVVWVTERRLNVVLPADQIYTQHRTWRDVQVEYKGSPIP
jgi:hypothetical protein